MIGLSPGAIFFGNIGISVNEIILQLSSIDTTRFIILTNLFLLLFIFIGSIDHVVVIFEKLKLSHPDNSKFGPRLKSMAAN